MDSENLLTPLESVALASVLEMAACQLYILDVGVCGSSPFQRSNSIAREKIRNVLENTMNEVRDKKTFNILRDYVEGEREKSQKGKILQREIERNRHRIEELKLKLKEHELAKSKEMNKKQEIIATLKDKIHEEMIRSNFKLNYADKWELTRCDQNRLKCQILTADLRQQVEVLNNKLKNETRVHEEMCNFLISEEKELNKEMLYWKEKYATEKRNKEDKIKFLKSKMKEQQILLRDMTKVYEERRQEINEYLTFKQMLRQEEEKFELLNHMATKIQAWWRGIMVRRGLGPFKKKKKISKEKKKKN